MDARVAKLAAEIASLGEKEQRALLEQLAEVTFRHGLIELSQNYLKRLQQQGMQNQAAKDILRKLKQMREEIAALEYPG